ncbi:MAG: ABC transporter permease [Armatimonadetes bacterium]|nr:ABC transporter permease [Armatimonadota bacterium]
MSSGVAVATSGVRFWRQLRRHPLALGGGAAILFIFLVALLAPLVSPYDPIAQDLDKRLQGPSPSHWLGTDTFGRDVLSRIIWGARISLLIGVGSIALAIVVGTAFGAVAGFYGKRTDWTVMRIVDLFLAVPGLFVIMVIVALVGPSISLTVLLIAFIFWPSTARIIRAVVLALRAQDFVEAARAVGADGPRIIVRHILPNTAAPVIVQFTLQIARAIILESGLSYLGLGTQPPTPSWGNILSEAQPHLRIAPWVATFSGMAIWLTTLCFNFLGDGLRDALDPRLQV